MQTTENLAVSSAVKIIEVPVIRTQEKTQQLAKQKPLIQEKINQVTKHVEVPQVHCLRRVADMPVVVQRQVFMVQKAVEVPQVQFLNNVD